MRYAIDLFIHPNERVYLLIHPNERVLKRKVQTTAPRLQLENALK